MTAVDAVDGELANPPDARIQEGSDSVAGRHNHLSDDDGSDGDGEVEFGNDEESQHGDDEELQHALGVQGKKTAQFLEEIDAEMAIIDEKLIRLGIIEG